MRTNLCDPETADVIRPAPFWRAHQDQPPQDGPQGDLHGVAGHAKSQATRSQTEALARSTVFDQFEAIVDSDQLSAAQKCILVKLRCRVDGKTYSSAIVNNTGLMRAASVADWRTLRAELRELEGKARAVPKTKVDDTIDHDCAVIYRGERPGKATVYSLNPDRFNAIVEAFYAYRQSKRDTARPPALRALPSSCGPPTSRARHPLHSLQGDPLHPMQTDPIPTSIDPESNAAPGATARDARGRFKLAKATEDQFDRFWAEYPRREGKAAAKKKFLTLSREDAELANHGAAAYATKCRADRTDPKYIKGPIGWLTERRFEDFAVSPRQRGQTVEEEVAEYTAKHPDISIDQIREVVASARKARGHD